MGQYQVEIAEQPSIMENTTTWRAVESSKRVKGLCMYVYMDGWFWI